MEMEELSVVQLHRYPEHLMGCCQLINEEWKRSETARLRSLECSRDNLPTCLILLKNKLVIGHCKLSVIPSIRDACFVESVVIDKNLRGKGYGTYLMEKVEDYCKNCLHLNTIYLSTKGQENFYKKLGYNVCAPISIYGGYTPNFSKFNDKVNSMIKPSNNNKLTNQTKTYMNKVI